MVLGRSVVLSSVGRDLPEWAETSCIEVFLTSRMIRLREARSFSELPFSHPHLAKAFRYEQIRLVLEVRRPWVDDFVSGAQLGG